MEIIDERIEKLKRGLSFYDTVENKNSLNNVDINYGLIDERTRFSGTFVTFSGVNHIQRFNVKELHLQAQIFPWILTLPNNDFDEDILNNLEKIGIKRIVEVNSNYLHPNSKIFLGDFIILYRLDINTLINNYFNLEKLNNMKSKGEDKEFFDSTLFIFNCYFWSDIIQNLREIGIKVSGGSDNRRHILNRTKYTLSLILFILGFSADKIDEGFTKAKKIFKMSHPTNKPKIKNKGGNLTLQNNNKREFHSNSVKFNSSKILF
jgi:hypothetical protein